MTYTIKLPQFEGPFDLLLFFIERDELDIYDIPVALITNDFLDYIKHLESLNIDIASEFILVAATLMRIKAKMLIPRKDLDEDGNELDPRQELVQRLLEYKSYKEIILELQSLEEIRLSKFNRGNILVELQVIANQAMADAELENLSLFRLLKTYQELLIKFNSREEDNTHRIYRYAYTTEDSKNYLVSLMSEHHKINAKTLLSKIENRTQAIFIFLAMLDLIQQEMISIVIESDEMNDFVLVSVIPESGDQTIE